MASEPFLGLRFSLGMVTEFASRPHASAWKLVSILFRATPVKNVWPPCSQSAGSQVSAVLFYARTAKFVQAQICVGDMRVFLSYKRRVGNIISVKTMVQRLPESARLAPSALSKWNDRKRNSTVKFIQGSKFKFHGPSGGPTRLASDGHVLHHIKLWSDPSFMAPSSSIIIPLTLTLLENMKYM